MMLALLIVLVVGAVLLTGLILAALISAVAWVLAYTPSPPSVGARAAARSLRAGR